VPRATAAISPLRGLAHRLGPHRIAVEPAALGATAPATATATGAWTGAVAAARLALAHQLGGASRSMLALARDHAVDRVQFGRPIARFQAVRHRLAEALVAVEALDSVVAAADTAAPLTAALAKATAGRTARTVAAHGQQVLAGVGFTTDHPFHRFLKRTMVLDGLFGGTDDLAVEIGRHLLATRAVPELVELG
jgi:alkylation response protein AidB-like acyl-CoA dehydrogenase